MSSWFGGTPSALEKSATDLLDSTSQAARGLLKSPEESLPYVGGAHGRRHTLVPDVVAEHLGLDEHHVDRETLSSEDALEFERSREEDASAAAADHGDGTIWHVQIVRDDHLDPKHCDAEGRLKKCRPVPQITASDFFDHLERRGGGVFFAGGPLNGWPGLVGLELRAITCAVKAPLGMPVSRIRRFWDASWPRSSASPPSYPKIGQLRSVRCTLRQPAFSARGWTPAETGFAFWIAPGPVVHVGSAAVANAPPCAATRCHLFAHRYAKPKAKETTKDLLTYHAAVLVEFDDGTGTLFEVAWRNGLGGYGGRSNWYPPADDGAPLPLFLAFPDALKLPWRSELLEVRANDVPFSNKDKLAKYLADHCGREPHHKFLDPKITHSADVRVMHKTKKDLMRYVLNYAARDPEYHEESRNCQHFAADFYAFLAGCGPVQPHSQVCRVLYKPRPYYFLYDP